MVLHNVDSLLLLLRHVFCITTFSPSDLIRLTKWKVTHFYLWVVRGRLVWNCTPPPDDDICGTLCCFKFKEDYVAVKSSVAQRVSSLYGPTLETIMMTDDTKSLSEHPDSALAVWAVGHWKCESVISEAMSKCGWVCFNEPFQRAGSQYVTRQHYSHWRCCLKITMQAAEQGAGIESALGWPGRYLADPATFSSF